MRVKKKTILHAVTALVLAVCLAGGLYTAGRASATEPVGEIYGREYAVQTVAKRFAVRTTSGDDISFSVSFPQTGFTDNYLALRLTVESVTGSFMTFRLGTNGSYFSSGAEDSVHTVKAVTDTGETVDVEQKFGYWFFVPVGFSGVLYIPRELCVIGGSHTPVRSLQDVCVFYDASAYGAASTVAFDKLYACSEVGASSDDCIVDFSALTADDDGNVTDARFSGTGVAAVNRAEQTGAYRCDGVELYADMAGAVVFGVKTPSEGGSVVENTYAYGWASIELGENAFAPTDGLAFTVLGISRECYFRVYLEDRNGALWQPRVALTEGMASFFRDGVDMGLRGMFGCLYMLKGEIGTAYIPYDDFVSVTYGGDFLGRDIAAGTEMGDIVRIHIGMDMVYGLGRRMAIGAFADVDLHTETVTSVVDLAKLDGTQVDTAQPALGTVLHCESSRTHTGNWVWSRLSAKQLPDYIDKDYLQRLVDTCSDMPDASYAESDWKQFQNHLTVAKAVLGNAFATQEQIDSAYRNLSAQKFKLLSPKQGKAGGCSSVAGQNGVWAAVAGIALLAVAVSLSAKRRRYEKQ